MEMPAGKAADATAPQRVTRDVCASALFKIFFTQEAIVLVHTGMCYQQRRNEGSIQLPAIRHSMVLIRLQLKFKAKIKI